MLIHTHIIDITGTHRNYGMQQITIKGTRTDESDIKKRRVVQSFSGSYMREARAIAVRIA